MSYNATVCLIFAIIFPIAGWFMPTWLGSEILLCDGLFFYGIYFIVSAIDNLGKNK